MFRIVGLQVLATMVVALVAWPRGGAHAALSALLGGSACVVPNALFALRLTLSARRAQGVPALHGIDTRMLTKRIRDGGAPLAKIEFEGLS
jgi:F0F1-type ATP synthase assembly protein I